MGGHVSAQELASLTRRIGELERLAGELAGARQRVKVIPLERAGEPIVGWRVWRVFALRELNRGVASYRLSSIGTKCNSKFWKPGEAKEAVCSGFESDHEAPWPDCECGLWALKRREDAEAIVARYSKSNGGPGVVAWALGRVSLWGRVIECERGWRARFAYPFDVTVFTDNEGLTRALRGLYAVDVARADQPPAIQEDEREEEEGEEEAEEGPSRPIVERPITDPLGPVTDEQALLALVAASVSRRASDWGLEQELMRLQGLETAGRAHNPANWQIVREALERLVQRGFVERGTERAYYSMVVLRLSDAGVRHVRRAIGEKTRITVTYGRYGRDVRTMTVATALRKLTGAEAILFAPEIARLREEWAPRRLEAKRKGRSHYRAWLEERRRTAHGRLSLSYPDEEIIAAVREASRISARRGRGRLVGFYAIMDRLAPGQYVAEERCPVGYKLVQLVKSGALSRGTLGGKPAWEPRS